MGISGAEQHTLQTHFGAFLKMRRDQWSVRQREVLLYLPGWTQTSYSRLESGTIAPAFDQLLPLYSALQQAGVQWDATDRQHYLALARKRIEEKKRQAEQHSERDWADLRYQLTNVDFLLDEPDEIPNRWSPPKPLQAETRHLLGRSEWLASITQAIQSHASKKLVVLHGPVGIGKSSELHRLIQHFIHASEPAYHVIWIPLLPAERSAGPESSLTLLLGNVLAESGAPPPTPEMASWEKRQRLVFAHLEQSSRPVVILVDNAENALMEDGSLSACWEEFLAHFLRRQHRATLVMATKEWPGWQGRDRMLVQESTVPPLDVPTCIQLLQQLGLESVPIQYLQEVCTRVGGIPLCLEWVAALAHDPLLLDDWQAVNLVQQPDVDITLRLERLLAEPLFLKGHIATKMQPLLERVLERRLSAGARALLHHLASCNVPLNATTLRTFCEHPRLLRELRNNSLLMAYSHRAQLLPVVASVVQQGLTPEQTRELEEHIIQALQRWVDEGSLDTQEAGHVITELAMLLLKHHRLLEAAELLIRYGWLSINQGSIPQIIQLVTNKLKQPGWHSTKDNECGGLLLRVFLRRYLKLENSGIEIVFQHIFQIARNKSVALSPGTRLYLLGNELRLLIMKDQQDNPHCYLDWQWFPRYHHLASYSDVSWLTQAGPFSDEEQREWDTLLHQKDDESASKRLATIIALSRKRELDLSLREQREPRFHYPRIPYDEVQSRSIGFSQLRAEIEREEPNVIVRRLYLAAIDELLIELNMIAATGQQDDDTFWAYNQRLNPTPNSAEMQIAVQDLARLLRRGLLLENTRDMAQQLIQQTGQWDIDPMGIKYSSEDAEQNAMISEEKRPVTANESQRLFSPETVRRFFADIFRQYQFPWTIRLDSATNHAHVSQSLKQLILPADKWISSEKIRQLLGHEIETHVFRAVSGEKSSLAILSIGLGGYLETEEGLAIYYTQEVDKYKAAGKSEKSWIGTLATGLAAGVMCKPYTFRELQLFLESVNILQSLFAESDLPFTEIREEARRNAQNRCLRTWRGVTDLTHPGICSVKDNVYLRGYLAVSQALEKDRTTFERLMVGSIGLQHLTDLTEIGITITHVKHLQFAIDPDLDAYIARFAG